VSERTPTAASLTRRAAAKIRDGEVDDGRRVLAEALATDPEFEFAWLWFASVARDDAERRFCLEQAAAANPESKAKQELVKLRRVAAREPPEVADLVAVPPPILSLPRQSATRHFKGASKRRTSGLGAVILGALVVLGTVLMTRVLHGPPPLYVAVVGSTAGADPAAAGEVIRSAQLYFDQVNGNGGIAGHPVDLLVYDDKSDPALATSIAQQIVSDGRALLVIGHRTSPESVAAGPIYAAAKLPAITSTSTADSITAGNPWYFRTVFDNRTEGSLIAAYAHDILHADHLSIVAGNTDYGKSLAASVVAGFRPFGAVRNLLQVDMSGAREQATVMAAVDKLKVDPDPGLIVLALLADPAAQALKALKAAGVTAPIIGGDAVASDALLATIADSGGPAPAWDGLYAAAPLMMDSLTSDALRFHDAYRQAIGLEPTWRSAATYDAAIAATTAMRAAGVTGAATDRAEERQRIRDALAAMDSPDHAVPGLLGPIYFDSHQTTPRAAVFAVARGSNFDSAYEQLRPYSGSGSTDLEEDLASGAAVQVNGQILERQRVVFSGIELNEIGELDTTNPSFYADFFLWLTYTGDDTATDIVFTNAVDSTLQLGEPERSEVRDGISYRLYHVTGRFKAPLEFHDFPFDRQHLTISFRNRLLPSSELVYALDHHFRDESQEERLQSGANAAVSINTIPNWQASEVELYQGSLGSTQILGDLGADPSTGGLEYSQFTIDVTIERNLAAFLVKNLLPLALLAMITYVSLFFPFKQATTRVSFGISGILTAAVLLSSVTSALPQVGYTVAIEWGFYAFIFLSATCILIGLIGDRLYEQRRFSDLRRLDILARIYYPAFVVLVVLAYFLHFSNRI
jgi:ABC-type branched-subunit amino acid transport system substrate-binding protein